MHYALNYLNKFRILGLENYLDKKKQQQACLLVLSNDHTCQHIRSSTHFISILYKGNKPKCTHASSICTVLE